ncbi:MAG: membrane protein insertase YidC [Deltaproteobacteria bacterium]
MEKRVLLAVALSMLILLVWSMLAPKTTTLPPPALQQKQPAAAGIPTQLTAPVTPQPSAPPIELSNDKFTVIFMEQQAAIREIVFKDYQSHHFILKYGFSLEDPTLNFTKQMISKDTVLFVASDSNKRISKQFIFHNSNYTMELGITIQNISAQPLNINLPLILGVLNLNADPNQGRFQDTIIALPDKNLHPNARNNITSAGIKFTGLRDRYFCAIIEPVNANYTAFIKKIMPQESEVGVIMPATTLDPGQQFQQNFHIYLGPQDLKIISEAKPEWSAIMYYGIFDVIAKLLLQLIEFIYGLVHNWGTTIIVLSILIYFCLYPLSIKQMRSVKEMQALQPRVEELKNIHKNNPQKLNKEIMELYREHKVNPLGGCLPLVLQIPIFFALYQALIRSIALKGAHFLWIKDLSEPDRAFIMPFSVPMLGKEFNVLPILMVITMFIQQKITTTASSGTSSEQQKFMLILMPLMFLFIFYHMPAGLVLYWFVNSVLMLLYQFKINRGQ